MFFLAYGSFVFAAPNDVLRAELSSRQCVKGFTEWGPGATQNKKKPLKSNRWQALTCSGLHCESSILLTQHRQFSWLQPHTPNLSSQQENARWWRGFTASPFWLPSKPRRRCRTEWRDHTDLSGIHPWLCSLTSVGEWVFLRLLSSPCFPTILCCKDYCYKFTICYHVGLKLMRPSAHLEF